MRTLITVIALSLPIYVHAAASVVATELTAHDGNAAETMTADVNIPGNGCTAGQVLIQFLVVEDSPSTVVTIDGDLTLIENLDRTNVRGTVARRTCDGGEGAQFNNTFDEAQAWAACVLKLDDVDTASGSDGGFDYDSLNSPGFDGTFDPPPLTPTGGEDEYLWIILVSIHDDGTVNTWPTNYTANGQSIFSDSNTAQQVTAACSYRTSTATTENPSAGQGSETDEEWQAWTLAAYPEEDDAFSVLRRRWQ